MSSRPDAVRCILLCLSRLSFSVRPFCGRFWCAWPRRDGGIPLSVRRNGKVSMPLAGCHGRCRLTIARYARFARWCLPQRSSDGFSSRLSSSPAVFRGLRRPRAGFLPLRRARTCTAVVTDGCAAHSRFNRMHLAFGGVRGRGAYRRKMPDRVKMKSKLDANQCFDSRN